LDGRGKRKRVQIILLRCFWEREREGLSGGEEVNWGGESIIGKRKRKETCQKKLFSFRVKEKPDRRVWNGVGRGKKKRFRSQRGRVLLLASKGGQVKSEQEVKEKLTLREGERGKEGAITSTLPEKENYFRL